MRHRSTVFRRLVQLVDRPAANRIERGRFSSERQERSLNRWRQFSVILSYIRPRMDPGAWCPSCEKICIGRPNLIFFVKQVTGFALWP